MTERFLERYIATLIGCALGDTLGMPVESFNRQQIKKYAGRVTQPIGAYINQLMTFLEEMNNSSTLQKIVIQCYSNQEFPSVILGE